MAVSSSAARAAALAACAGPQGGRGVGERGVTLAPGPAHLLRVEERHVDGLVLGDLELWGARGWTMGGQGVGGVTHTSGGGS